MTREPDHNQTLIAAENGPVIEADDTGLVLRLSDRVIRDIARRIGLPAAPEAAPEAAPAQPASATVQRLDAALLGDIDAWDLQREGEWLRFLAHRPGPQGARRYRRHASGGGIIAETPGPILGLLSLGNLALGRRLSHGLDGRFVRLDRGVQLGGLCVEPLLRDLHPALELRQGGALMWRMDAGISVSEDPVFRFAWTPGQGPVTVHAEDTEGRVWDQSF